MNKCKQPEADIQATDEELVLNYLREHPDFFEQHPEILADLELHHECGSAISLVERQTQILRQQNNKLRIQLEELVKIARDNDTLNERMHRLTLALMDACNLNDVYIALDDCLRGEFQTDAVAVKLFIDPETVEIEPDNELMQTIMVPLTDPRLSEFRSILRSDKPVCGKLKQEHLQYMFGEGKEIQSTALVPLGGDNCTMDDCPFLGVLAIGSRNPNRFQSNLGTLFLTNLGEIVGRAIRPYVTRKKIAEADE